MVPAPPAAHAGEASAEPLWLRELARWLRLGRDKVAILIEDASPGGMRPLVRSLLLLGERPRICFNSPELLEVPDEALVVLTVQSDELSWLNLNRPILANKKLRLLLWLTFPLSELRGGAPDFFDWISHVVRCPPGPPGFVRRELEAARRARLSLQWRGGGLDAAFVGIPTQEIAAEGRFEGLVGRLLERPDHIPIWVGVDDARRMLRIDLAMRQARISFAVAKSSSIESTRWVEFEAEPRPWSTAVARLRSLWPDSDRSTIAWLAALFECEAAALEILVRAASVGHSVDVLLEGVLETEDAGAWLIELLGAERGEGPWPASIALRSKSGYIHPAPYDELSRRHIEAVRSHRCAAWVRAAGQARLAGHPDIALVLSEEAVRSATGTRQQRRAVVARATALHAVGDYDRAGEIYDELLEVLERESLQCPLLGLLLTEQAALLSEQGQHEDSAISSAHAIQIWERCDRRMLTPVFQEAVRLQGHSLIAAGDRPAHADFLVRVSNRAGRSSWRQSVLLERARGGDVDARRTLLHEYQAGPEPRASRLALELSELMLDVGEVESVVEVCESVLASLRTRFGTEIHPIGVDARMLAARATAKSNAEAASALLQPALSACEQIYGDRPHQRTVRVMMQLADLLRAQGDLDSALALVERARVLMRVVPPLGGVGDLVRGELVAFLEEIEADEQAKGRGRSTGVRSLLKSLGPPTGADYERTDAELVLAVQSGDSNALDELVTRYVGWVRGFIVKRVPEDTVDDLVQRTFEAWVQAIPQFSFRISVKTYLTIILSRQIGKYFRVKHKRSSLSDIENLDEELLPSIPDPQSILEENEQVHILLYSIKSLLPEEQLLLWLRYWEKLSTNEMARMQGLRASVVRGRTRVASRRLRAAIERTTNSREHLESRAGSFEDWAREMQALHSR